MNYLRFIGKGALGIPRQILRCKQASWTNSDQKLPTALLKKNQASTPTLPFQNRLIVFHELSSLHWEGDIGSFPRQILRFKQALLTN
jgi:hypothetical protein